MHNSQPKDKLKGFTLLEVLVYVLVFILIVGGLTSMVLQIYRNKIVIEDRININEDLRLLTKSLRDDVYMGSDLVVNSSNNLTIRRAVGSDIVYYESNNRVYRQEGSDLPVAITAGTTNVQIFNIQDISSPTAAKTIRVRFVLSNFAAGALKPEILQDVTTTFSLKFI